ncbi:hypothetical protein I552_0220 [Mycobacterium xenopi 3993]|nr:hypothetical protein I552_0220 [Mycobacterium xenopi 3993]
MPLSDHEQRMLEQIESALYAEDPKFASSVRGAGLRAPTARRRLQGAALFVIGLGMLVSGVAFKATMIGSFPILSVFGFVVMFGGVVYAITGPGSPAGETAPGRPARHVAPKVSADRSPAAWRIASAVALTSSAERAGCSRGSPGLPHFLCPRPDKCGASSRRCPTMPHLVDRCCHIGC